MPDQIASAEVIGRDGNPVEDSVTEVSNFSALKLLLQTQHFLLDARPLSAIGCTVERKRFASLLGHRSAERKKGHSTGEAARLDRRSRSTVIKHPRVTRGKPPLHRPLSFRGTQSGRSLLKSGSSSATFLRFSTWFALSTRTTKERRRALAEPGG